MSRLALGIPLEQVMDGFVGSSEYYERVTAGSNFPNTTYVAAVYENLLNRAGNGSEITFWVSQLPTLGDNGVALGFFQSREYRSIFVTGLYYTILRRQASPSSGEVAGWVDSAEPLLAIEASFAGLPEFYLLNEAVNTSNTFYVTQLYFDMLSRQPDPGGLASFTGLLDQHLTSRAQVLLDIEQSVEYRIDQVNQAYEHYLHRAADPSGLQMGLSVLANFGMESELEFIASSPEFLRLQGGGTIDGWLSAIYADALGREADPGSRAAFDFELNTGLINLRQAAHIIFTSQEYDRDIIDQYYMAFLLRNPDTGGGAAWLSEMLAGLSVDQLVVGIASSAEYFQLA
jgi:hypothetical protein